MTLGIFSQARRVDNTTCTMYTSPQGSRRIFFLCLVSFAVLGALVVTSPLAAQTASQLTCSPCSLSFGNVTVGGSQELPVTFTNSGTSMITIRSFEKGTPWFFYPRGLPLPYKLPAGQSVTFNMVYAPTRGRASSGTFTFASDASNSSLVLSVSGTGVGAGTLAANPPSLGFGWVPLGSERTKTITVTNTTQSAVIVNQISSLGSPAVNPFTVSGVTAPFTLAAGQSYTFNVTFTPQSMGDVFGNMVLISTSGEQLSIAENGVGATAGVLRINPSSVNFGNVTVGSSQTQTLTLAAAANQVTVTADSLASTEFSISGVSLPLTLATGQSVPVTVTFSPQASGAANASLAFTTGTGAASISTSLTGNGVATVAHTVTLTWQPSTSEVMGYNVYRGNQSAGPYSKLNSATDGSTTFADGTVQGGSSYFYEVTSVDATGTESVPSAPVEATIPTS